MGLDLNSWLTYKGMTLEIIIWSMFLGIVIGAVAIMYNKNVLGAFVRKLIEEKADSPESAKTLAETGFARNPFVKFSLSIRGTYRKIIQATPADNFSTGLPHPSLTDGATQEREEMTENKKNKKEKNPPRRPQLSELKFFIPHEMTMRADSLYSNKGTSLLILLLTVALFLTVAILSFTIIPGLIQMLKNFVEFVKPIE
jgi:ABC-type amino acid transport system permease subunit